jgi:DMSO/TMAO reductase YedYZ molybdopterin-dependent catalytic subunit
MILNTHPKMRRREFMTAAGGTLVSIGLSGIFVKLLDSENRAFAAQLRPDGRPRIPPGQHAVRALVPMGGIDGPGDIANWKLQVSGELDSLLSLNFKDLKKLSQASMMVTTSCLTSSWAGKPGSTTTRIAGGLNFRP